MGSAGILWDLKDLRIPGIPDPWDPRKGSGTGSTGMIPDPWDPRRGSWEVRDGKDRDPLGSQKSLFRDPRSLGSQERILGA